MNLPCFLDKDNPLDYIMAYDKGVFESGCARPFGFPWSTTNRRKRSHRVDHESPLAHRNPKGLNRLQTHPFLLTIFGKSEKVDLSQAERNQLAKLTDILVESYGDR